MQNNNAVIYARYSSEQQSEGYSIEAQLRACTEYAKKQGLNITKHYIDEALTASSKTDHRIQFMQLIQDAKLKEFGFVIVHKLDRFARNKYDHAFYKRALNKYNIERLSVSENIDNSPEGQLLEGVIETISEFYSNNLARETMKGLMEVARQCKHTGGLAPLGYNVDPDTKKYVTNEQESEHIKTIFKMFNSGNGYGKILDALPGAKTKRGNKLSQNTIHHILKNEKYTGLYIFNKQASKNSLGTRNGKENKPQGEQVRIKGGMPQIITSEVFEMAQEKLQKNKHTRGGASKRGNHIYLLSHIACCGLCGSRMYGAGSKGKTYYYQCSKQKKQHTCSMKLVRAKDIELAVQSYFKQVFTDENISELINFIQKNYKLIANDKAKVATELKEQLKQTHERIQKVINILIDTPSEELRYKLLELESSKSNIKAQIKKHSSKYNEEAFNIDNLKQYFNYVQTFEELPREQQKALIDNYIEFVEVYPEESEQRKVIIKTVLDQKLGLAPGNSLSTEALKVEYNGGESPRVGVFNFYSMFVCEMLIKGI